WLLSACCLWSGTCGGAGALCNLARVGGSPGVYLMTQREKSGPESEERGRRVTKKEQIVSLYRAGISEVEDLAMIVGARPSYVASVLQVSEHLPSYFDLYTTTAHPMNVYSKFFARKLGFKDPEAAERSVELLDHYYRQFELAADRAGQHHALLLALT